MWSTGRNRYVEAGYVWELKDAFVKGSLERGAPKNCIAVLCSAKECETRLGLETFNISTFEWIASLWIDDYWLPTLEDCLAAVTANGRTREAVEAAFYTSDGGDGSHHHTTGLLKTMDDAAYRKVCWAMWTAPDLALVDLKHLLHSKRPEIETAVRVLYYVIG
ncbi:hypothetical protein CMUS01_15193 [Colletotrichum musicola]|uniref:Uncharacterized protein n=1 Tax=Colletotrichum musicola TaxID=2175873 RepID=A0A8H6MN89_9PEZI|nr:hypothetical protein CMUS01_15193 [Colletotrichum musicola]